VNTPRPLFGCGCPIREKSPRRIFPAGRDPIPALQIKIRSSYQGEDFINSHPGIDLCAAFPIPAQEGDEDDIVVYAVRKSGETLSEEDLRAWARAEMPKFMWPKYIRFLEDLPRTPTNRVEKYRLKAKILGEMKR
jgi:carnitine-CoA ligase